MNVPLTKRNWKLKAVQKKEDNSVIAFRRIDEKGKEIIVVCNFTNVERCDYRIGIPKKGAYKIVFNSDDVAFGGAG